MTIVLHWGKTLTIRCDNADEAAALVQTLRARRPTGSVTHAPRMMELIHDCPAGITTTAIAEDLEIPQTAVGPVRVALDSILRDLGLQPKLVYDAKMIRGCDSQETYYTPGPDADRAVAAIGGGS